MDILWMKKQLKHLMQSMYSEILNLLASANKIIMQRKPY